jgi:hypothetical protein
VPARMLMIVSGQAGRAMPPFGRGNWQLATGNGGATRPSRRRTSAPSRRKA